MEGISVTASQLQHREEDCVSTWTIPQASANPTYNLWTPLKALPSTFLGQLVSSRVVTQPAKHRESNLIDVLLRRSFLDELIESASIMYSIDHALRELTSAAQTSSFSSRNSKHQNLSQQKPDFKAAAPEDLELCELQQERYLQQLLLTADI